jgi:predicted CopG family antitoxin
MGMKANTIKIENPLLEELYRLKPKSTSFSEFLRSLLKQCVTRSKMGAAAEKYQAFLEDNADEREWLGEWAEADLAKPSTVKKGKSK